MPFKKQNVCALLGKKSRVIYILGTLCPRYLKYDQGWGHSSVITECPHTHKDFLFPAQSVNQTKPNQTKYFLQLISPEQS